MECLFCGTEIPSNYYLKESVGDNLTLLEKQLSAVFVLRELLDVSQNALQKCFALSNGENPDNWLIYCDNCRSIVRKAEELFQQISTAKLKLKECQSEIQSKILASKRNTQSDWIYRIIRENTKINVTEICDPTPGDRIADQLLAFKLKPPPIISPSGIKVEPKTEPFEDPPTLKDDNNFSYIEMDAEFFVPSPDSAPDLPPQPKPPKVKKPRKTTKPFQRLKGRFPLTPEQEINFNCLECGKICKSRTSLRDHIYNNHRRSKVPSIPCPHCDFLCARQNNLTRHIKHVHEKEYNFACEICGQVVSTSEKLRDHEAGQYFKCSVKNCQIICKSKERLRDHQVQRHGREVTLFKCDHCPLIMTKMYKLRKHMKNRHGSIRKGKAENV